MGEFVVRPFQAEDAPALARIYHRAVREGAASAYSPDQRRAWSPEPPEGADWVDRLGRSHTVVAWGERAPVGFITVDLARAHVELVFVAPEAAGQGVGSVLLAIVERMADARCIFELTVHASDVALPLFLAHGWQEGSREVVERNGVRLGRTAMTRRRAVAEAA